MIKTQTSSRFLVRELGHDFMESRETHKGLLLKQPGKDNDRNIDRPGVILPGRIREVS